jgi:GTPase SAR1 family protein
MVVGDTGVGKTSLIKSFLGDEECLLPTDPTNNVDIFFKKIKVKDGSLPLNV